MKFDTQGYKFLSILFINASIAFLVISILFSDRLFFSLLFPGMSLFFTGIFIYSFAKGRLIDARIASLLPLQATINLCKIFSHQGSKNSSIVIPSQDKKWETNLQVSLNSGENVTIPTLDRPLLMHLKEKYALDLSPSGPDGIKIIQEIFVNIFDLADSVDAKWSQDTLNVKLKGYVLLKGCIQLHKTSPSCCTLFPCPICSLIASIIAIKTGKKVRIQKIGIDPNTNSLTITLTSLPN